MGDREQELDNRTRLGREVFQSVFENTEAKKNKETSVELIEDFCQNSTQAVAAFAMAGEHVFSGYLTLLQKQSPEDIGAVLLFLCGWGTCIDVQKAACLLFKDSSRRPSWLCGDNVQLCNILVRSLMCHCALKYDMIVMSTSELQQIEEEKLLELTGGKGTQVIPEELLPRKNVEDSVFSLSHLSFLRAASQYLPGNQKNMKRQKTSIAGRRSLSYLKTCRKKTSYFCIETMLTIFGLNTLLSTSESGVKFALEVTGYMASSDCKTEIECPKCSPPEEPFKGVAIINARLRYCLQHGIFKSFDGKYASKRRIWIQTKEGSLWRSCDLLKDDGESHNCSLEIPALSSLPEFSIHQTCPMDIAKEKPRSDQQNLGATSEKILPIASIYLKRLENGTIVHAKLHDDIDPSEFLPSSEYLRPEIHEQFMARIQELFDKKQSKYLSPSEFGINFEVKSMNLPLPRNEVGENSGTNIITIDGAFSPSFVTKWLAHTDTQLFITDRVPFHQERKILLVHTCGQGGF